MPRRSRVVLHHDQFRAFLTSEGMVNEIDRRVQRIADAAGEGFEGDTLQGENRAVGGVVATTTEAIIAERRDRVLTNAIDAGR